VHYMDFLLRPARDETSGILCLMAEARDITEARKAEAALLRNAQQMEWLMKSMVKAFVMWETVFDEGGRLVDARFVYFNDAYERASGLKLDEVRGRRCVKSGPNQSNAGSMSLKRWH